MRPFVRSCLFGLAVAVFALGCGKSESNPRAIDIKPDPRLKRVGEGNPAPAKGEQSPKTLRP
jgi:hypothetical protein